MKWRRETAAEKAGRAAERLVVSDRAARRLLGRGRLDLVATAGRTHRIDGASVDRLLRTGTRRGRAWSEATAGAALSLLSGEAVNWIGTSEKSRLNAKLRNLSVDEIPLLASNRSTIRRFHATADVVQALRSHLVLSGAAAMGEDGIADRFGLTGGAGSAEEYVAAGGADALRAAFGMIEARKGNVLISAHRPRQQSLLQGTADSRDDRWTSPHHQRCTPH